MAKYIRFDKDPGGEECAGRPLYWISNKKGGEAIGRVFWYSPWRQWCVEFNENSVWSQDCLGDVRDFIATLRR